MKIFLSFLSACSLANGSQSPRDRKTKTPGTFGSFSSLFSPNTKRTKVVRISDTVSFHDHDEREDERELSVGISSKDDGNIPRRLSINSNAVCADSTGPTTPISSIAASITKTSLQDADKSSSFSPQQSFTFRTIELHPRPILKRQITRRAIGTIQLFRDGSETDLQNYYDQGTQLPMMEHSTMEMLKYLFESGQFGKLGIIFSRDRMILLSFILKSMEITNKSLTIFANNNIFEPNIIELDPIKLRASIYLHAVQFEIEHVYKIVLELIDSGSHVHMVKELLREYYGKKGVQPLLVFAAKNDTEEEILSILNFEPSELTRLDSKGCSVLYHAAYKGNLDILEALKGKTGIGEMVGKSPLLAAAINNREDSLEFLLAEDESGKSFFNFTDAEIEDAAFASSVHGNIRILKILLATKRLNLYCFRGPATLLSSALRSGQFGFAQRLVGIFNYNVNFVGIDPINPEGHALTFLLNKYDSAEFFLKRGANLKIMVPVCEIEDGPVTQIPLSQYLKISQDAKLIKLINKYS